MHAKSPVASEAPARILALVVAANGRIDDSELRTLDGLEAYRRLGVKRERFIELSQHCLEEIGTSLCEQSWLRMSDMLYINALLGQVDDPAKRLLVCRLAAGVITADGRVSKDERRVYDHILGHWQISQPMVTDAILHDHDHAH
ncbi:MAG TPA: hypothetical protein VET87_24020 [Rubrivivax sp.]|jgi:uncharacterized tellurite resistance protein B-like protein|nr:hypothetical protein [Rubrivivax sp.]